jgi:hypothetical protein
MKMKRQSIFAVLMLGVIMSSGCATHCHGGKPIVYNGRSFDGCALHTVHTGSQPTVQTAHRSYQHAQSGVGARHDGRNGRR